MSSKILVKSSNIFLIPVFIGYWNNHIFYSLACLNLYLSSQAYHRKNTRLSYIWDQTAIQTVWWIGVYYNLQLEPVYSAQYWFITLYLWFIYYYGFLKKKYCFGDCADEWHATIHYTSALGIILTQVFSRNQPL